jgi:acetylglutamate kinase
VQTFVIKYGGSVSAEPTHLLEEIALRAQSGDRLAVVHGGGPEITSWLARIGHESEFVGGQRVTDETTLAVAEMVLAGRVVKRIVRTLQEFGARAAGISGEDAGLFQCGLFDPSGRLGLVGRVVKVDIRLVDELLSAGFIPVVAPLGCDETGQALNVNADVAAGALAGALGADIFLLATDVAGVKMGPNAPEPIPRLTENQARAMIASGVIAGGMIPKVEAALFAVSGGAAAACIADARRPGLLAALARGEAVGTRIVPDEERGVSYA